MKGILFKPDMIKAIVEGRKTVTRRIINPQPNKLGDIYVDASQCYRREGALLIWQDGAKTRAKYQPGEVVYIKEVWATYRANDDWTISQIPDTATIFYKLDEPDGFSPIGKWRSPMFLKAILARYFIKIKDVRPERLQEITEEDAIKEGFEETHRDYMGSTTWKMETIKARWYFREKWNAINPKTPWESNPWVWRIEFELTEKPNADI